MAGANGTSTHASAHAAAAKERKLRTRSEAKREREAERIVAIPSDPVSEDLVLVAMMHDARVRHDLLARLRPDHFDSERHRAIFVGLRELDERGHDFDPATLMRIVGDDVVSADYLERLHSSRSEVPANVEQHVRWLVDDETMRRVLTGPMRELLDAVEGTDRSTERARAAALRVLTGLEVGADATEPFASVDATDLAKPLAPIAQVVRRYGIAPGRPTLLAGFGGAGKTLLVQELALAVATGAKACWGDVPVTARGNVLHVDYEMTLHPVQHRYQRLAHAREIDLASLGRRLEVASMPTVYLSSEDAEAALARKCVGKTLVIIDNLLASCPDGKGENDASIRKNLDKLTRVSSKTGCTFVVLVHEGKSSDSSKNRPRLQRVRGASAITDAAGSVVSVWAKDGVLTIDHSKPTMGPKGESARVTFTDVGQETMNKATGAWEKPGLSITATTSGPDESDEGAPSDAAVERAKQAIVDVLRKAKEPPGVRELMRLVRGVRVEAKKAALAELREQRIVLEGSGARGAKPLRLAQDALDESEEDEGGQDADRLF